MNKISEPNSKYTNKHSNQPQESPKKSMAGKIFFISLIVIFGVLYFFVINQGKKLRGENSVIIEKMVKKSNSK